MLRIALRSKLVQSAPSWSAMRGVSNHEGECAPARPHPSRRAHLHTNRWHDLACALLRMRTSIATQALERRSSYPSIWRRLRQLAPLVRLHTDDQLVAVATGLKHGGLAF